jgi:hypothetical protein
VTVTRSGGPAPPSHHPTNRLLLWRAGMRSTSEGVYGRILPSLTGCLPVATRCSKRRHEPE